MLYIKKLKDRRILSFLKRKTTQIHTEGWITGPVRYFQTGHRDIICLSSAEYIHNYSQAVLSSVSKLLHQIQGHLYHIQ